MSELQSSSCPDSAGGLFAAKSNPLSFLMDACFVRERTDVY